MKAYKVQFISESECEDDWYDDDFLKGSVHYYLEKEYDDEDDDVAYSFYEDGKPFGTICSSSYFWESFDEGDYTITEITIEEYNKQVEA